MNAEHVLAHRLRAAGDLLRGLALQPQGDEEAADLGGGRLAGHDRVHRRASLLPVEGFAVEQPAQSMCDHRLIPRKFFASSGPTGVSTDSGWNWTPSIGSSGWRTAMTSPSAAVAEISSTSGIRVAASEW